MKIYSLLLSILLIVSSPFFTKAQIGIGTLTPDSSAILDLSSPNKGFLPPRIALTANNVGTPISNPATGLLVYNTAVSGVGSLAVEPGYYYWNGSKWIALENRAKNYGDMQFWDGTKWETIPLGNNGDHLIICNGKPKWGLNCTNMLTFSPANNPNAGHVDSYSTSGFNSGDTQFDITAWTANGSLELQRTFIKIDFPGLPANAIIDSARFYLYSMPNPHGGNGVDANYGGNNSGYIQRITSNWSTANPLYTWFSQPTATAVNQAIIPHSPFSFEDIVVDITNIVKDMQVYGNNGMLMKLQVEQTYNIRQFASSYYPDTTKHPKIKIWYH